MEPPGTRGRDVQVRLYFANRCDVHRRPWASASSTSLSTDATVLNDYDIVADVGHNVGTMKSFDITSDGNVDIDFGHVVENPLINAIEIFDLDAPPPSGDLTPPAVAPTTAPRLGRPPRCRLLASRGAPFGAPSTPTAGSSRHGRTAHTPRARTTARRSAHRRP